jgi:hypothetical protein
VSATNSATETKNHARQHTCEKTVVGGRRLKLRRWEAPGFDADHVARSSIREMWRSVFDRPGIDPNDANAIVQAFPAERFGEGHQGGVAGAA